MPAVLHDQSVETKARKKRQRIGSVVSGVVVRSPRSVQRERKGAHTDMSDAGYNALVDGKKRLQEILGASKMQAAIQREMAPGLSENLPAGKQKCNAIRGLVLRAWDTSVLEAMSNGVAAEKEAVD